MSEQGRSLRTALQPRRGFFAREAAESVRPRCARSGGAFSFRSTSLRQLDRLKAEAPHVCAGHAHADAGLAPTIHPRALTEGSHSLRAAFLVLAAFLVSLLSVGKVSAAQNTSVRVRLEWGGGAPRSWAGTIRTSAGRIDDLQILGSQPEEHASTWLDRDGVRVQARRPRTYMGIEFTVEAPLESVLSVQLGDPAPAAPLQIPLARLLDEVVEETLDDQKNWLQARRSPSDRVRVSFERPGLVFAPRENFVFRVTLGALGLRPGAKAEIDVALLAARGGAEVSRRQYAVSEGSGESASVLVELPLPPAEGVYDVLIAVQTPRLGISAPFAKSWWQNALARRRLQLIVIDPRGPVAEAAPRAGGPRMLEEIDPTHPARWQRLGNLTTLPGMKKGPLSAGKLTVAPYPNEAGELRLASLAGESIPGEPAWQAYPLTLQNPNRPHCVEVEYPLDRPQSMGISIVEPTLGELPTATVDGGLFLPEEAKESKPGLTVHRTVFWPRSRSPLVLLTTRRPEEPIYYGKIRIWECGAKLTATTLVGEANGWVEPTGGAASQRSLALYLDGGRFLDALLAGRAVDSVSRRSLQDWQTFYDGGSRLLEYMRASRRDVLFLAAASDGGTLYPSPLLQPTPKLDDGALFGDGPDPVSKDVLEMYLRLCDRDGARFIPVLRWNATLPALETFRRSGPESAAGMEVVGPDGRAYASPLFDRWKTAGYNLLDERVQSALLASVRELTPRLAGHPSCGGLAIELSGDSFALLPSSWAGLDDRTTAQFEHEAGLRVPAAGDDRLRIRQRLYSEEPLRSRWLNWRAQQLAGFYSQLQDEVRRAVPGGRLYLLPARVWTSLELQQTARRALTQGGTLLDAWLAVGIDPRLYVGEDRPTLFRPSMSAPTELLPAGDLDPDLNDSADLDHLFAATGAPGAVVYHVSQEQSITSPETSSILRAAPKLTLASQTSPGGDAARQRFARALSGGDLFLLADGGASLGLGEDRLLAPMRELFRSLPAEHFRPVPDVPQPLVLRTFAQGEFTWFYAVNDSPWPIRAEIPLVFPRTASAVGLSSAPLGLRQADRGAVWELPLAPFEARGLRLGTPYVQVGAATLDAGGAASEALRQRLNDLGGRMAGLIPLDDSPDSPVLSWNLTRELPNPGFESPPSRESLLPGWAANAQGGVEIGILPGRPHSGQYAARIRSSGPVATLASLPAAPPPSGVLLLSVWLRAEGTGTTAPLRLAVEGTRNGPAYYRFAAVGGTPNGPRLDATWRSFLFRVDDLAGAGLKDVRIRFDLMGPGEVWVDDVQLSSVLLTSPDLIHLRKHLATARFALEAGRGADARRLLTSYWPRILAREAPIVQTIVPDVEPAAAPPSAPPASVETTNRSWYDRMLPTWWR